MRYALQMAKMGELVVRGQAPSTDLRGFVLERKMDGVRAVFEMSETETRIWSRTGKDLLAQFPEFARIHELVPNAVLDGEIICLNADGRDDLELLQPRLGCTGQKALDRSASNPATVRFFDVLEDGGQDQRSEPWKMRRAILEALVGPDFCTEFLPLGEAIPLDWEGVIAKKLSAPYFSGARNGTWLKFKFVYRATLYAVALTPGTGARASSFGAVVCVDSNGVPRGQVGSGFTDESLKAVMDAMQGMMTPLIEVEYRFLSKSGLMVNTSFKGIRADKDEADAL